VSEGHGCASRGASGEKCRKAKLKEEKEASLWEHLTGKEESNQLQVASDIRIYYLTQ
jgi:hypothetical protein